MEIIYSLIAKLLIGKTFIMNNWIVDTDDNGNPIKENITFTVRGYSKKFGLDINFVDCPIPTFLSDWREGKICRVK